MGARRGQRTAPTGSIVGQHLALAHAAGLARNQLLAHAASTHDGQRLSDMLDTVACALAKAVPLYVADGGTTRELTPAELAEAKVSRGATVLNLKDGRTLFRVSIRRADMRQAIALLKAAGVPGISPSPEKSSMGAAPPRRDEWRARLAELEAVLGTSLQPAQVAQADRLLLAIARNAPTGMVADFAMRLMSAVHDAAGDCGSAPLRAALQQLRSAVDEQDKSTQD